ncbi:hypothetical protein OHA88_16215 [Streptomyces sp. NBC_00353]|uniref:hypothetical protein n=1 Tax=Streptomyces sp. NBC_00353 TaxID=2975722 RepID=UPI002E260648
MSFTNPPPPPPSYPPTPPPPPEPPKGPGLRKLAIAAIVVAVLAAGGVGFAITHQSDGGNDSSEDNADGSGVPANQPDLLGTCIASWNKNNMNKAGVGSVQTAAQTSAKPTAYVHVGANEMFPDRCMITVANPSTMIAEQFVQDGGSGWGVAPAWYGSASQLDESVIDWNASMAQDGTITVS